MTCRLQFGGAFLHLPKTGGSWVYDVLCAGGVVGPAVGGHEHSWNHREQWAFTVLRDPVDWWISIWKHRMDNNWCPWSGGDMHPLWETEHFREDDLKDWIARAAAEFPGYCGKVYALYAANSKFQLQTEHLKEHLRLLAHYVGWKRVNVDRPRVNVGRAWVDRTGIDFRPLRKSEEQAEYLWQHAAIEPESNFSI